MTRPASVERLLHARFDGVLDPFDGVELDIDQHAVDLHPADIRGLDDITGRRVDRDRAARTVPRHFKRGRLPYEFTLGHELLGGNHTRPAVAHYTSLGG